MQVEQADAPAPALPGSLGQVDAAFAVEARAAAPARPPGAGDGTQGGVLAQPADDGDAEAVQGLEEGGLGVRPIGHDP
jgi:hypothetical protein